MRPTTPRVITTALAGILTGLALHTTPSTARAELPIGAEPIPPPPVACPTASRPAYLFFVPHQDDETLSMAGAIRQALADGHDVHLVLMTNGSRSAVRDALKKGIAYEGFVRQHDLGPITADAREDRFVAARLAEFRHAAEELGVCADNVHVDDLQRYEGQPTAATMRTAVARHLGNYPGAVAGTMSWIDNHRDHAALGYALDAMSAAGQVGRVVFFAKRYLVGPGTTGCNGQACSHPPLDVVTHDERTGRSADAYAVWDPLWQRYAVGAISVPLDFAGTRQDPTTYAHGPSGGWTDTAERNRSREQLGKLQSPWQDEVLGRTPVRPPKPGSRPAGSEDSLDTIYRAGADDIRKRSSGKHIGRQRGHGG